MTNKPGKSGIPRLIAATRYSLQGLQAAWQHEEAFRIETCLAVIFIPLSFVISNNLNHQLILTLSCVLVLFAELINSAIEAIVDRIGPEQHPLSGRAKDIGSAGVMLCLLFFLLVWSLSGWHYISGQGISG